MTYKQLLDKLKNLTDEQLTDDILILVDNVYHSVNHSKVTTKKDKVLHSDIFVLIGE